MSQPPQPAAPPRATVVIPTLNRAGLIVRTLDALGRQTLPASQFEVLVADDGSTDGTPDVVRWATVFRRGNQIVNRGEIEQAVRQLRPWYQNVSLGQGIWTKDLTDPTNVCPGANIPHGLWTAIEPIFPTDLRGRRALDVGCNAGFFSIKLREGGASVTGIDLDQVSGTSFSSG